MAPIHDAAHFGTLIQVKALLNQGANKNARDASGWTPLHHAANAGRLSIVQELIKRGARVNSRTANGVTPLHLASLESHSRVVHGLMKAGANPMYRNTQGHSAYNYASFNTNQNALKTSRAATKWLAMARKRRAERMLLSPRLLGSTPLTKNTIRSIARFVTVKKNSG